MACFGVCPLYDGLRSRLPFRAEQVLVEGHMMQGNGCTVQNHAVSRRHRAAWQARLGRAAVRCAFRHMRQRAARAVVSSFRRGCSLSQFPFDLLGGLPLRWSHCYNGYAHFQFPNLFCFVSIV